MPRYRKNWLKPYFMGKTKQKYHLSDIFVERGLKQKPKPDIESAQPDHIYCDLSIYSKDFHGYLGRPYFQKELHIYRKTL